MKNKRNLHFVAILFHTPWWGGRNGVSKVSLCPPESSDVAQEFIWGHPKVVRHNHGTSSTSEFYLSHHQYLRLPRSPVAVSCHQESHKQGKPRWDGVGETMWVRCYFALLSHQMVHKNLSEAIQKLLYTITELLPPQSFILVTINT